MESFSLLTPLGYQFSSCGYCKSPDRSPSYYCHGYRSIRPADYEVLANRMWRRSGTTYYKPDSKNACCPHYTIRLDSAAFQVSRNQRQICNKFTSFVLGEDYRRQAGRWFPKSREDKKRRRETFDVCQRVHEPEWDMLPKQNATDKVPAVTPVHRFTVSLEPDVFTEEKYALFAEYQRVIHKEPPARISKSGFKGFLCSGFSQTTLEDHDSTRPIGSYHQCYRLDGKLVALAVLDLLPNCVSSVYLIYHPDHSQWEFGKLSALREIAMAKEAGYRYYYMGYYIHSCAKMKYKRAFKPTYVLDPESYEWNLFDDNLLARFEQHKYVSLAQDRRLASSQEVETAQDPQATETTENPFARMSIFASGMTGIASVDEIVANLPLSDVPFFFEGNIVSIPTMAWDVEEMRKPSTLLGKLAEFISCIGIGNIAMRSNPGTTLVPALEWLNDEDEEDEQ